MVPRAAAIALALALVVPGVASAKGTKFKIESVKADYAGVASQTACTSTVTFIEYQADVSERIGRPAGKLDLKGHKNRRGGTLRATGFSGLFEQTGAWQQIDCGTSTIFGTGSCDSSRSLPLTLAIDFIQKPNQAMKVKFAPFDGVRELGPELTCGPATYGPGLRGNRRCLGRIKAKQLKKRRISLSPDLCEAQLISPDGAALSLAVKLKVELTRG